jgi:Helix-turn-helix domain of transposase family ISL3/Transposase
VRVCTAFSRLLDLPGVWVRKVCFEPGRVVVAVVLRRRRLECPKCSYLTWNRENKQRHDSTWRHLDLGVWRLEVHARLRQLRCPEHGVHVEGVPFARDGARFTRDFENLVAWLATKTDKTATCRLTRIDWATIGRVIERVGRELIDTDRLTGLFEISIDEVAWRKGHRYLTLVGDHRRRCVVWGTEGKGQAAADPFFAELDPPPHTAAPERAKQPRQPPEPAIMVPFGPCPTVPAGHGIHGAWLQPGSELDPAIFARASRLRAVSMDMTGGYAKSVREHAPQAVICIDNYHVVQLAHEGAGRGSSRALERAAPRRQDRRRQAVQARPLGALAQPGRSHRPASRHACCDPHRRREGPARLGDEGDGQSDLRPRPHRQRRRRADRPAAEPSLPLPPETVHPARPNDPQTPRGHPRRPTPGLEQRPGRGAEQQGEAHRPARLRIPFRQRRARARSPHLRAGNTHTPTRTSVRVTSPTIIPGEP